MSDDPRAGELPGDDDLIDVDALIAAYHDERPDPSEETQRVSFGTSGHRGTATARTFNEAHVLAIAEAVARHRKAEGIDGPLFLGRDTHALSEPATRTIVEVLGARGVDVVLDADDGATPTPVISHAILTHNRGGGRGTADGIVVTPSHNPPGDGGFKYNPPHGGPADTDVTGAIQDAANELLEADLRGVERIRFEDAPVQKRDYVSAYVDDLEAVIDLDAIRGAGLKLGVDPLGGASLRYWEAIAQRAGLDLEIVNRELDPTFRFVPLDWDGKIRMDCSSPYAMGRLREMADRFDVAFANDPDADRHGVVVPVGFKWFVDGLLDGSIGFGGEESAGASFLRRDGSPWSTDKDGLIPCLLAAEMKATTGKDPGELYAELAERFGNAAYRRTDVGATAEQKDVLKRLSPDQVKGDELAGEPIEEVLTEAPGNGAPIGGLKVVAAHGWFAARPSGTEDVYKVYAESLDGEQRLGRIVDEAERIVGDALGG